MLANAGIDGQLVLVGHSIGAAFARLYAASYPEQVQGMVLSDHAGRVQITPGQGRPGIAPNGGLLQTGLPSWPVLAPPPSFGFPSEEQSLRRLPGDAQDLHRWAVSLLKAKNGTSNIPFYNRCMADASRTTKSRSDPLGDRPLIVIANAAIAGSEDYKEAQAGYLALSHNSRASVAATNGHSIPMDDPGVLIEGIRQVVVAVRKNGRLN